MTDNKTSFNMNTVNGSIHINKPGKNFKKNLKKLKEALGPDATVTHRQEWDGTFIFFTLTTEGDISEPEIMAAVRKISGIDTDSHVVFADFRDVGKGDWMLNMPLVQIYDLEKPYCIIASDCTTSVHPLGTNKQAPDAKKMLASYNFSRHMNTPKYI